MAHQVSNITPTSSNTFDPYDADERVGHFWKAVNLAAEAGKSFTIWNDRVYVTSGTVMYDTGYQRKDLK